MKGYAVTPFGRLDVVGMALREGSIVVELHGKATHRYAATASLPLDLYGEDNTLVDSTLVDLGTSGAPIKPGDTVDLPMRLRIEGVPW